MTDKYARYSNKKVIWSSTGGPRVVDEHKIKSSGGWGALVATVIIAIPLVALVLYFFPPVH